MKCESIALCTEQQLKQLLLLLLLLPLPLLPQPLLLQVNHLCCMWSSCGVHVSASSSDDCCCSKCRLRDAVTTSVADTVCAASLPCFYRVNTQKQYTNQALESIRTSTTVKKFHSDYTVHEYELWQNSTGAWPELEVDQKWSSLSHQNLTHFCRYLMSRLSSSTSCSYKIWEILVKIM